MPCHHALAEALHAYINAAGIAEDRKKAGFSEPPAATTAMPYPIKPWISPPPVSIGVQRAPQIGVQKEPLFGIGSGLSR